jgi:NTE family protein
VSANLPLQEKRPHARPALVLSGGGARGAYEAGVIAYVFGPLADRLGFVPRFDVFSGTSVGAVHSCFLAGYASQLQAGARELVDVWRNMKFESVYRFSGRDLLGFSATLLGSAFGRATESRAHGDRIHGLLNTTPLERLVVGQIPWRQLRRNIRYGPVDTLCLSATEIASGRTVSFVDNRERRVPSWTRDPLQVAVPARIGPGHTLASASIPFLFPAVRVGDTYYCDGGLRQHTPLTPALRLGADRVLVIGLRYAQPHELDDRIADERLEQFRSVSFLAGKVLNALLIDRLEYDVAHMRVLNQVIQAGINACGEDHLEHITPEVEKVRGMGFRLVKDAFVRPSQDIAGIAARHVREQRGSTPGWVSSAVFRALTRGAPDDEADMMSFLMFDGEYAAELIELGMRDAEQAENEIAALFLDAPGE